MPTRRNVVASAVLLLALLTLTVRAAEPAAASLKAADMLELAERFAEFDEKLPEPTTLGLRRIIAFEEHRHFVYVMGELPNSGDKSAGVRRVVFVKPATFVVDQLAGDTRFVVVRHVGKGGPAKCERSEKDGTIQMKLTAGDRVCELILPTGSGEGTIAVTQSEKKLLAKRLLPAGIMPHGPKGVAMIERWDAAYRGRRPAPWDSGQPNSRLTEAVENGTIKPGRVAVLGCGSGTNAVYLATKGFEVTALDVAPTALAIAQAKAAKAKVKVRWLLADVLAPPTLEPFDFLFDSGCYHCIRRANAAGYVKTANTLAKPGALMLILAGNANEPRHHGPPRVEETDLVSDFAETWDFVHLRELRPSGDPSREGAPWFWSALLRRRWDGDHARR